MLKLFRKSNQRKDNKEKQKNRTTGAEANPEVGGTLYYWVPTSIMIDGTNSLLITRSLFHSDQLFITGSLFYFSSVTRDFSLISHDSPLNMALAGLVKWPLSIGCFYCQSPVRREQEHSSCRWWKKKRKFPRWRRGPACPLENNRNSIEGQS